MKVAVSAIFNLFAEGTPRPHRERLLHVVRDLGHVFYICTYCFKFASVHLLKA